jgi:hypothetical protein
MRMFGLRWRISRAASSYPGAKSTSMNCWESASASAASTGRFRQMTPPNALIGSHSKARV